MNRVKLIFPDQNTALYRTNIPIRISDINYGGHLGNDSVLSIIHEARVQMLHQWQYTELNAAGTGLIMADVMIAYKAEAFYGDIVHVDIYATEITIRSFDLLYRLYNSQGDIAHAKTGMLCYDYENRKIAQMPDTLKNKLARIDF